MQTMDEKTVHFKRITDSLIKKWWVLLLCALIAGGAAFGISTWVIAPKYTAEVLMYVNNSAISVGTLKASISAQDLTAAQGLVDTYTVILNSRNTLEDVIDAENLSYSYEEMKKMIEAEPVNNTEVFSIDVTSTSAVEAEKIANTIARILPDKIADIVEGSSAKIVDYAVLPAYKSSPNTARWTILAAAAAVILAGMAILIKELSNDQIKDPKDLMARYPRVPVLANIPNLDARARSNYGYGEYQKPADTKKTAGPSVQAPAAGLKPAAAADHAASQQDKNTDTEGFRHSADPAETKDPSSHTLDSTKEDHPVLSRSERLGRENQDENEK